MISKMKSKAQENVRVMSESVELLGVEPGPPDSVSPMRTAVN